NVIMQAALYGLPECNLHHGAGMKWARVRPLIAGWHFVYPAYDNVGLCKRSAARLYRLRSCRPGPEMEPASLRLLSISPGTLRLGEKQRTEPLSLCAAGQMHHGRYLQR